MDLLNNDECDWSISDKEVSRGCIWEISKRGPLRSLLSVRMFVSRIHTVLRKDMHYGGDSRL